MPLYWRFEPGQLDKKEIRHPDSKGSSKSIFIIIDIYKNTKNTHTCMHIQSIRVKKSSVKLHDKKINTQNSITFCILAMKNPKMKLRKQFNLQ